MMRELIIIFPSEPHTYFPASKYHFLRYFRAFMKVRSHNETYSAQIRKQTLQLIP